MKLINKKLSFGFMLTTGLIIVSLPIGYNTIYMIFGDFHEYRGDNPVRTLIGPAFALVLPLMISFAIYRHKKLNEGFLKLKEAIILGLKIALVTAIAIVTYDILFNNVLAPDYFVRYFEQYGDQLYADLVACCDMTKEGFERHKNNKLENLEVYIVDLLSPLIIGLMVSTIVGLILRKKKPVD